MAAKQIKLAGVSINFEFLAANTKTLDGLKEQNIFSQFEPAKQELLYNRLWNMIEGKEAVKDDYMDEESLKQIEIGRRKFEEFIKTKIIDAGIIDNESYSGIKEMINGLAFNHLQGDVLFLTDYILYPGTAFKNFHRLSEGEKHLKHVQVLEREASNLKPYLKNLAQRIRNVYLKNTPYEVENFLLEIENFFYNLSHICRYHNYKFEKSLYYNTIENWISDLRKEFSTEKLKIRNDMILVNEMVKPKENQEVKKDNVDKKGKGGSVAQVVLAMHYIFHYLHVRDTEVDRTDKARFIQFLTGKDWDNIYKATGDPFTTKEKNFRFDDLQIIRAYFEDLGLSEIVKMINNQLASPK